MGLTGETVSPVVAECFDDFLSDSASRPIAAKDVLAAIESAAGGPVAEGAVGGGTGMTCFGFKGGIGTSSRKIKSGATVGVLVMANTGGRDELRIDGAPVGREIRGFEEIEKRTKSIILIAATDAPLLSYQLKKIAKRVALGLAKVGANSGTGSGDIILAFSTANRVRRISAAAGPKHPGRQRFSDHAPLPGDHRGHPGSHPQRPDLRRDRRRQGRQHVLRDPARPGRKDHEKIPQAGGVGRARRRRIPSPTSPGSGSGISPFTGTSRARREA